MLWLQLVGPLAGVLGLVVAVFGALLQRRGQTHLESVDAERLGHADLVAALELYRQQVPELKAEVDKWRDKHDAAQTKLTDLLFLLETRREP